MRSPSGAPLPEDDKSYELGDLELAPRSRRKSAGRPGEDELDEELTIVDEPRPELGAAHPANDYGLEEFERGNQLEERGDAASYDGFGEDHSIELDLPHGDHPLRRVSSAPPLRQSLPNASLPPGASRAPRPSNPVDEEKSARELARFGEPNSGLGAPAYVLHVLGRMLTLYRARRPIEQSASLLADAYEKALRDLGRALLSDSAVMQHEGLRERVLVVQTRQGELADAEAATQKARELEESEQRALQQKAAALEAELSPFLEAEQRALAAQEKLDAELKRKSAKLQRAEIELRALSRASIPPPPERLESIASERAQHQAELDALSAAQAEATAALGRARRELALRRGTLDGVDRQQLQRQSAANTKTRAHEEAVAKAEHALSAALCSLAEAAEAVGLAHSAAEQVDGLRASERALDEVVDQLARYDRALTMYDQPALLRGGLMWLGFFAALAILIKLW